MPKVLFRFLAVVLGYGCCSCFLVGRGGATAFLIQMEDEDIATDSATSARRQLRPRTIAPVLTTRNRGFNFTGGVNAAEDNNHRTHPLNATLVPDSDLRKHIVNGYTVNQATNRYPYTVLLYRNDFDRFYCGGSLIAPDIVSLE